MVRIKKSLLLLTLTAGQVGTLQAADWSFTPYVTLGEIYTDNVALAPEGQEESEFITLLNPGFTLYQDRGRVKANVAYQMQNLFYADDSDFNETFHQLDAFAVGEIVREHLFVDATSTIAQQVIDAERTAALNNFSVTGNRTDAITAAISPHLHQKFGASTQALARYRYGIVDFDDDEVSAFNNVAAADATVNGGILAIGTQLREEKRLSWLAAYSQDRVDSEGVDAVDKFEEAGLRLDLRLTRTFGLTALGGYENNKFERTETSLDTTGEFWEAGTFWQPTARDSIEARYGERFFGNTYFLSWGHAGRRFATTIAYSEDVTTLAQTLLGESGELFDYGIFDPVRFNSFEDKTSTEGRLLIDPDTGLPVGSTPLDPSTGLPVQGLSLTSDVFEAKRLEGSVALNTAKTFTLINVFQEDRDFEDLALSDDERIRGIQAFLRWHFASHTDLLTEVDYAREDFSDDSQSADLIRARLGIEHSFGLQTLGRVEATRTERNSDDGLAEYTENAIIASVTRRF